MDAERAIKHEVKMEAADLVKKATDARVAKARKKIAAADKKFKTYSSGGTSR